MTSSSKPARRLRANSASSCMSARRRLRSTTASSPIAAFLFGPDGKILNRYDKIHMFDVDLDNGESWRESAAYRPGSEARVLSLPFAEMGFTICYDVRFPAAFPCPGGCRGRGDDRSGRLHEADRRGALGNPAAGARHRERRLRHRRGAGRPCTKTGARRSAIR